MRPALLCAALMTFLIAPGFAADGPGAGPSPAMTAGATAPAAANPSLPAAALAAASVPPSMPAPAFPAAPSALVVLKKKAPAAHNFLDAKNSFALSAAAVTIAADALSTQKGLAYPGFYEINPIARPFVRTRAGAAVYSGASLCFLAGGMYLAHRTRHHRIERILPFAVAGWEGLLSARNYRVIATRAR